MKLAAFLAMLVALVWAAAAGPAVGAQGRPSAAQLESELVCPVCETTLDQSDSPIAERMKAFIRARIAAGDSAKQIEDKLVAQFGPDVLATPSKSGFGLLAWLVPLVAVGGAALAVGLLVWAWSRRRAPPDADPPLDPDLERRVDAELARFEN